MDDVTYEKRVDTVVQRRLATDHAYLNAEDAAQQSKREEEIVAEVEHEIRGQDARWNRRS